MRRLHLLLVGFICLTLIVSMFGMVSARPTNYSSTSTDVGGDIWIINATQGGDIYDADGFTTGTVPYNGTDAMPEKSDGIDVVHNSSESRLYGFDSDTNAELWNTSLTVTGGLEFWGRNDEKVVLVDTDNREAIHVENGTQAWSSTAGAQDDEDAGSTGTTYWVRPDAAEVFDIHYMENGTMACGNDIGNHLTGSYVEEPHAYLIHDHFNGDNNRNRWVKVWAGNCTVAEIGDRATRTRDVETASHPDSDYVFTRIDNSNTGATAGHLAAHYKSNMSRAWGFETFGGYQDTALYDTGEYLLVANDTHIARHSKSDGSLLWRRELNTQGSAGIEFVWGGGTGTGTTNLTLEVDAFMQHGSTQEYVVKNGTKDVSSAANVTSSDIDVIVVDEAENTLTSTSDETVNQQVTITAAFDGESVSENVTVSNLSVDNLEILPDASTRLAGLFGNAPNGDGDRPGGTQLTMQVLLVATMAGVAATVAASAFAGIGAMTIVLAMGWFQGWVGDGVMLGAVFTGLFIGLNLATNIDYSIRR